MLTASVIIASLARPASLRRCLESLHTQATPPIEVVVVWQGTDVETRECVTQFPWNAPCALRHVHTPDVGITAAENAGIASSRGDVVIFIDDDAVASSDFVYKHLRHYSDSSIGAVGGPFTNFYPDGRA